MEKRRGSSAGFIRDPSNHHVSPHGVKTTIPSAVPLHWPNPTASDLELCPSRKVVLNEKQKFWFATNFIRTSKYTTANFMPKFMAQVSCSAGANELGGLSGEEGVGERPGFC